MTWANLEEDQANSVRAEEIRNLYFQQRTEVVDDESWIMGFLDIIDPAIDSIKRLLNLNQNSYYKVKESTSNTIAGDETDGNTEESAGSSSANVNNNNIDTGSGFDLDDFIRVMLCLDPSKLEVQLQTSLKDPPNTIRTTSGVWRPAKKTSRTSTKL